LQNALNKWADNLFGESQEPLIDDGLFGAATYRTVTAFQNAKGLGVDGVVGKNTWAALEPYL
jgi:peptidoglycan hydrolase-like protein with peptidoglycan-binding domain